MLITVFEYNPYQNPYISWQKWTDIYTKVIKLLFEGGADPTWTLVDSERSALYYFFQSIFHIIVNKDGAIHSIMELLLLFISEKSLNSLKEKQVNPLIALFDIDFLEFFKDLNKQVKVAGASLPDIVNYIS